jgi:hypothetical protein
MSCAKVSGILYALIGLIVGALFSFVALIGAAIGNSPEGMLFGIGAIILMPIFYGVLGFVGGAIAAWLYNIIVGWIGGIEVEFEDGGATQVGPSSPQHQD